jgi:hypothetical protein
MSLSDKIESASKHSNIKPCKIGLLLSGTSLSEIDKRSLIAAFETPEGTQGRISNVALSKIFREEGYNISLSTVDRHRRHECGCYNLSAGN